MKHSALALSLLLIAGAAAAQETTAESEPAAAESVTELSPVSATEPQPETQLGEVGETCQARRDCRPGLHCINTVCHSSHEGDSCSSTEDCPDGLACRQQQCVSPFARPTSEAGGDAPVSPLAQGFHLGAGVNLGIGPVSWFAASWEDIQLVAGFLASVHIVAMYEGFAGELEVAPATFLPTLEGDNIPFVTTGHLALGYYLALSERVHLVFRSGAGVALGVSSLASDKYLLFSARIEPLSLAYAWDRVAVELTLPSIRILTDLENRTVVGWFVALRTTFLFL